MIRGNSASRSCERAWRRRSRDRAGGPTPASSRRTARPSASARPRRPARSPGCCRRAVISASRSNRADLLGRRLEQLLERDRAAEAAIVGGDDAAHAAARDLALGDVLRRIDQRQLVRRGGGARGRCVATGGDGVAVRSRRSGAAVGRAGAPGVERWRRRRRIERVGATAMVGRARSSAARASSAAGSPGRGAPHLLGMYRHVCSAPRRSRRSRPAASARPRQRHRSHDVVDPAARARRSGERVRPGRRTTAASAATDRRGTPTSWAR